MTRLLSSLLASAAILAPASALAQQAPDNSQAGTQIAALDNSTYAPATENVIVTARHSQERESQALIDLLADEISRPEYQVRFHWTPHALVIWDNRATAHAGPIDYAHFNAPRIVRRITVAGDLPKGPDGFV